MPTKTIAMTGTAQALRYIEACNPSDNEVVPTSTGGNCTAYSIDLPTEGYVLLTGEDPLMPVWPTIDASGLIDGDIMVAVGVYNDPDDPICEQVSYDVEWFGLPVLLQQIWQDNS